MITLNFINKKKILLNAFLCLFIFTTYSQVSTSNTEITGVTVDFAFDEEVTDTKNNVKENIIDNNDDTDWAGNLGNATGEASIIFSLGSAYNLAEIQYLTVAKSDPYAFQLLVSTDGTNYTDVYGGALQQSNLDGTYKQFVLPTVQNNITHVKLMCFGRINATTEANTSAWNTISELRFYQEGAVASVEENELQLTQLFPVPTNNKLLIKNNSTAISKVEIYNVIGKKVISSKVTSTIQEINTSDLSEGMYLVKLINNNNVSTTKKIIVKH